MIHSILEHIKRHKLSYSLCSAFLFVAIGVFSYFSTSNIHFTDDLSGQVGRALSKKCKGICTDLAASTDSRTTPEGGTLMAGSKSNLVSKYVFSSNGENFQVKTLTVVNDMSGDFGDNVIGTSAVATVSVKYQNVNGLQQTMSVPLSSSGEAKFTGLNFYVTAGKQNFLEVYVDTNSKAVIGDSIVGKTLRLGLKNFRNSTRSFNALGQSSGITENFIGKPSPYVINSALVNSFVVDTTTTPTTSDAACVPNPAIPRYPADNADQFTVGDPFGLRGGNVHHGLDFQMPQDTPVYPTLPGKVVDIAEEWKANHSQTRVKLEHILPSDLTLSDGTILSAGTPVYTNNSHLNGIPMNPDGTPALKIGDMVDQCTVIGFSGYDNGPAHLHWEFRLSPGKEADSIQPFDLLPFNKINPLAVSIPAENINLNSLNPSFSVLTETKDSTLVLTGVKVKVLDTMGTLEQGDDVVVWSQDYNFPTLSKNPGVYDGLVTGMDDPYAYDDPVYKVKVIFTPSLPLPQNVAIEAEAYGSAGTKSSVKWTQ